MTKLECDENLANLLARFEKLKNQADVIPLDATVLLQRLNSSPAYIFDKADELKKAIDILEIGLQQKLGNLKKGQKVWAKGEKRNEWELKYFSHIDCEGFHCFDNEMKQDTKVHSFCAPYDSIPNHQTTFS